MKKRHQAQRPDEMEQKVFIFVTNLSDRSTKMELITRCSEDRRLFLQNLEENDQTLTTSSLSGRSAPRIWLFAVHGLSRMNPLGRPTLFLRLLSLTMGVEATRRVRQKVVGKESVTVAGVPPPAQ